jgi:hypothetical protein
MSIDPRTHGVMSEAVSTVYGVAAARYAGNLAGAHMLIRTHFEDAAERGVHPDETWGMLLGAAVVTLCDQIEDTAREHGTSPMAKLTELAMTHAAAKE